MAFTLPLIGDLADLGLNDFQIGPGNARKIRGYVRTNLGAGDALIDTTNQVTLLGDTPITILSNGTWSVDLLDTSSTDLNVEANTLQYELVVEYTSTGSPAKRVYRSGWFALTEADLELVDDVPMAVFSSLDLDLPSVTPSWRSAFVASMEAIATTSAASATSAAASADAAATIVGLTGEDAAVALLIDTPASDTATALSATIEAGIAADATDPAGAIPAAVVTVGDERFSQIGTGSELLKYQRQIAKIQTSFESGHGWTLAGAATAADTSDYIFGEQSLSLTAAAGTFASASKTGLTAVDGTANQWRVWFKSTDLTKVNRMTLLVSSDPTFAAYYSMQNNVNNSAELGRVWKSGEWTCMEFHWATANTTGSPTKTAITAVRLLVYADAGAPATVKVNRVEAVPDPGGAFPNGVITLSFDDSFAEHYTVARKKMSLYGMPGTLFPIIERLDQPGYLTTAQVDELAFQHQWEIGGHATTYAKHVQSLTGMTSDERRQELREIRAWQQSRGYQSYSYAYPNGNCDAASQADLQQFFSQARLALNQGRQTQVPIRPLRIQTINANVGATTLTAVLNTVSTSRQWFNVMVHDIVASGGTANAITPTDFNTFIDNLAASGLPVRTMGEVLRANAA